MEVRIDLRSDTVTQQTEVMRRAMYEAKVGDDVYGEDPTMRRLEELACEMTGKEAALFATSGTQGNQLAILSHCSIGQEVIAEELSHIYTLEGAAPAALAGVQVKPIAGFHGALTAEAVERAIHPHDIHKGDIGLICMENTHNQAGGRVIPLSKMKEVYQVGQKYNIPVHVDGARIFNAMVASGTSLKEYAATCDSMQFCLSKGLAAPVGSLLVGSRPFIERARHWRKRMGGGLRQSGFLAAAGIVALTEMVDRLAEDHMNAKRLAEGLQEIPGFQVNPADIETNILLCDITGTGMTSTQLIDQLHDVGIIASAFNSNSIRFVTHYGITAEMIDEALLRIKHLMTITA